MAKTYSIVLLPDAEEGGYTVLVPALPGCITEGDTADEAIANAHEAIDVHIEGSRRSGDPVPEESMRPAIVEYEVA
jgi:predicted RNase H-like HicB family nuclease